MSSQNHPHDPSSSGAEINYQFDARAALQPLQQYTPFLHAILMSYSKAGSSQPDEYLRSLVERFIHPDKSKALDENERRLLQATALLAKNQWNPTGDMLETLKSLEQEAINQWVETLPKGNAEAEIAAFTILPRWWEEELGTLKSPEIAALTIRPRWWEAELGTLKSPEQEAINQAADEPSEQQRLWRGRR